MKLSPGFSLFEILIALFLISSSIVLLIEQQEQNSAQINRLFSRFLGVQTDIYAFSYD